MRRSLIDFKNHVTIFSLTMPSSHLRTCPHSFNITGTEERHYLVHRHLRFVSLSFSVPRLNFTDSLHFSPTTLQCIQNRENIDPESLERENDQSIAALGERVGLLRNVSCRLFIFLFFLDIPHLYSFHQQRHSSTIQQITSGIHSETQTHHALLDRMAQGFGGAQLGLGATVGKFRKVMDDPQGKRTVYIALGIALVLFLLYVWSR